MCRVTKLRDGVLPGPASVLFTQQGSDRRRAARNCLCCCTFVHSACNRLAIHDMIFSPIEPLLLRFVLIELLLLRS